MIDISIIIVTYNSKWFELKATIKSVLMQKGINYEIIFADDGSKIKWNEKLFMGKIADSTKALVDAQDVMYWLEKHHVRYIFHGHKHIPCVVKKGNTYIMAGGSSCGGGTRERKSSYLSYNLLKYNRKDQAFKYCFVFYDDLTKQERHRVKIKLFLEEKNEVSR